MANNAIKEITSHSRSYCVSTSNVIEFNGVYFFIYITADCIMELVATSLSRLSLRNMQLILLTDHSSLYGNALFYYSIIYMHLSITVLTGNALEG